MNVDLACRKLVFRLAAIGAALIAIALAMVGLAAVSGRNVAVVDFHQFDLRNVGNFPVLFTTALFTLAAILAVPAARIARGRRDRLAWYRLAAICVYLALDETVRLRDSLDHLLAPLGRFPVLAGHRFLWLYAVAGVLLAVARRGFIASQPRRTPVAIVLGAILYGLGITATAFVTPFHAAPAVLGDSVADLMLGLLGQSLCIAGALTLIWGELRLLERARLTVAVEIGIAGAEAAAPAASVASTADRHAA